MTWTALVLRRRAWLAAIVCSVLLCACKTELYTKRSENDANQMVGVLLQNGVDAEKTTAGALDSRIPTIATTIDPATTSTCPGRSEPMRPRRSSGPKR